MRRKGSWEPAVGGVDLGQVNETVRAMLSSLGTCIRDQGFSQVKVQEALGWGRSYISQLMTRQKKVRIVQVLSILEVIGVAPETFFGEFFGWRESSLGPRRHRRDVDSEVGTYLSRLRIYARRRGFTQRQIEEALGWGQGYLSQLGFRVKHLRVEQVLMIVSVIRMSSSEFFRRVYYGLEPGTMVAAVESRDFELVREHIDAMRDLIDRFGEILVKRGLVTSGEVEAVREVSKGEDGNERGG